MMNRLNRKYFHARWATVLGLGYLLTALCYPAVDANAQSAKKIQNDLRAQVEQFEGTRWYGVYVFGQKAGHAKMSLSKKDGAYQVAETVKMKIQAFGNSQTILLESTRKYELATGALTHVKSSFRQDDQEIRSELKVERGSALLVQWVSGKRTERRVDQPRENIRDALALSLRQVSGNQAKIVETRIFETLPPLSKELVMQHKVLKTEERIVDGVPLKLSVISTKVVDQGIHYQTLMKSDGEVVETEMMGMMKLRLEPEKIAKGEGVTPDVLTLSLAKPNEPIPNPRDLRELSLRIKLPEEPKTFGDGHVEVINRTPEFVEIRLRSTPLNRRSGTQIAAPETLAPTSLIQSDAPEILAKAKEVVKGAQNRQEMIKRLVDHVSTSLSKEYRAALSNALDVLKDPAGDCTEHAVYFVALARALKIPSRVVVGLTYTDLGAGGFGGHAWAEVLYRGGWHPVDPTFGQISADATHIPLGVGNLSDFGRVANLIGNVKVRVLDLQHHTK